MVDQQGRTVDGLGRVVPGPVNVVGMLGVAAVREVFAAFREVPSGFVVRDGEQRPRAVVCPCGLGHMVGSIREAECGRWFVATSHRVLVWRPVRAADGPGGLDRTLDPSRASAA